MQYQDQEQGKRFAQSQQRAHDYPLNWQMESIMEQRNASERSANDESLSPERRKIAAEFAALLNGYLVAWD